jgi:2-polyprenyl-3-methyl-5-hydroxy-6-metoxy-1,4-benzoquinol methylase
LSKFSRYATGGDFDVEMVEHNREEYACLPNVEFCELDLLNVAKHKRRYDVVVSLDVIEHFPRCKAETVASSYAKLLRPGGFAIVGTPNKVSAAWASKRRLQSHAYEFGPKDFESVLRSSFKRVFLFSMTDEIVSTSFLPLAWYLMAVCTK